MFKVEENTKIYIVAPYHNTGGPKSLHQLADSLVDNGIDTYMVYYWNGNFTGEKTILFPFCKAKVVSNIEDNEKNLLIVSESQVDIFKEYHKIRKCIWWLSLDFYLTSTVWGAAKKAIKQKRLSRVLQPLMLVKFILNDSENLKKFKDPLQKEIRNIYHMYNCEYVKNYLEKHGVIEDRMRYLCGPLEDKYYKIELDEVKKYKENLVAYNPAKMDMYFLRKVQEELNKYEINIKFIAIKNMNRQQVFATLRKAKVYIDFGFFPGPERMPREAVALYCNIITSTDGSAANDIDVEIPRKFKFNIKNKKSVKTVAKLMDEMINNYQDYICYGDNYRRKVWKQIENFQGTIKEIFEVK